MGFLFSLNYNHKLILLTVCDKLFMNDEGVNTDRNTNTHFQHKQYTLVCVYTRIYILVYIYLYISAYNVHNVLLRS